MLVLAGLAATTWQEPSSAQPTATIPATTQATTDTSNEAAHALKARVDTLENQLQTLQAEMAKRQEPPKLDISALETKIAALETKLNAVQNSPSSTANLQHIALLNALTELQKSIGRGMAFSRELAQLKELAKDRKSTLSLLAELEKFSPNPTPTVQSLWNAFADAMDAREQARADGSLLGNLRSLVRIRKVGAPAGSDDDAIIARAENALVEGEISASITELSQLSGASAPLFRSCLEAALAYQKIHSTLDALLVDLSQKDMHAAPADKPVPPPVPALEPEPAALPEPEQPS